MCKQGSNNHLNSVEELAIEATVAYQKYLACQLPSPMARLAAFGAIALNEKRLRQIIEFREQSHTTIISKSLLMDASV